MDLEIKAWRLAAKAAAMPVTALLRRQDRHLLHRLAALHTGDSRKGVYPEVDPSELILRTTEVHLSNIPAAPYNVTITELLCVAGLSATMRPTVTFEFGTANGRSTLAIAENAGPDSQVYTINLPLDQDHVHSQDVPVGECFLDSQAARKITQLWGNTKTFDYSPWRGRCEFIFIDADHSHSGVLSDSMAALELIDRQRGIILWHDALRYGVQAALPEIRDKQNLPIHLLSGTNLAILCFVDGNAAAPQQWARAVASSRRESCG